MSPLRQGLSGGRKRGDQEDRELGNRPANESRTLGEKVWVTGLTHLSTGMPVILCFCPSISLNFKLSVKVCLSVPSLPTFLYNLYM